MLAVDGVDVGRVMLVSEENLNNDSLEFGDFRHFFTSAIYILSEQTMYDKQRLFNSLFFLRSISKIRKIEVER